MSSPGVGGELISLVTVMLAQAINIQDRSAAAQLRETLRCLSLFDQVVCRVLSESSVPELSLRASNHQAFSLDFCLKKI